MNLNDYKNELKEIDKYFDKQLTAAEREYKRTAGNLAKEEKRFADWLQAYQNTPQYTPPTMGFAQMIERANRDIFPKKRPLDLAREEARIAFGHYDTIAANKRSWVKKLQDRFKVAYLDQAGQEAQRQFDAFIETS